MIGKGQAFVRAIKSDTGQMGNVDILNLDNDSFRRVIVTILCDAGLLVSIKGEPAKPQPLKERVKHGT